jgi:putative SOS response-associated peptidase YedK
MCGRYVLEATPEQLQQEFNLTELPTIESRYNIAPSQPMAIITNDSPQELTLVKWGLVPHWSKDPGIGNKMINARSETAAEKPSFRTSFKYRRCLIPASGFYEWRKTDDGKIPQYIYLENQPVFSFAGLWSVWTDPDGGELWTATILTTTASETIKPLHERMPVILPRESRELWLDKEADPAALQSLMKPYDNGTIEYYPVSKAVNKPVNDNPTLIEREDPPQQQSMF